MILPGGRFAPGTAQVDRFRYSSETRVAQSSTAGTRTWWLAYQRGRLDMLHARLAGDFTTIQLYQAFTRGEQAVNQLMAASTPPSAPTTDDRSETLLDPIEEYLAFNSGRG